MEFTITRPDGSTEKRRHIQYTVAQTGPSVWEAYNKRNKRLMGRSYRSEAHLRASCDCMTEPA